MPAASVCSGTAPLGRQLIVTRISAGINIHPRRTQHRALSTEHQHQAAAPSTEHVAVGTIDRHLSGLTQ